MSRKSQDGEALKKNELAFAILLARGVSVAEASKKVGVALSTAYRWSKRRDLREVVEDVRQEVLRTASNRLVGICVKAIDRLGRLLDSDSEQIQLSAARAVLDSTVKVRELAGLESEVERIHEILAAIRDHNKNSGLSHALSI